MPPHTRDSRTLLWHPHPKDGLICTPHGYRTMYGTPPDPQFKWTNTVSATPNMVYVECGCPPKVINQCPAIPRVWVHCPQCPMVALAAENGVYTTIRHPNRTIRTTNGQIRWSGTRNVVMVVNVWPPKVINQCPAILGVGGHCPQCPMAALAAKDGVHTTIRHPNGAIRNGQIPCRQRGMWSWWCMCGPPR